MAVDLLASWRRQFRAQARAHAAQQASVRAMLAAAWRKLPNPYDPEAEAAFAIEAGRIVDQGRQAFADVTLYTLRRTLQDAGVTPPSTPKLPERPRGIDVTEEMLRATKEARWRISQGMDPSRAMAAGLRRAQSMAEMDLAVAARDAYTAAVKDVPQVIGTRREIHPELSESGVCGLCIAAATRIYKKRALMPLHAHCKCQPVPVLLGQDDIAQILNGQSLRELYEGLGLTGRQKLSKVRVREVEHGELGPLLVDAEHAFRGPGDLAA
jgi:hypothetical protein